MNNMRIRWSSINKRSLCTNREKTQSWISHTEAWFLERGREKKPVPGTGCDSCWCLLWVKKKSCAGLWFLFRCTQSNPLLWYLWFVVGSKVRGRYESIKIFGQATSGMKKVLARGPGRQQHCSSSTVSLRVCNCNELRSSCVYFSLALSQRWYRLCKMSPSLSWGRSGKWLASMTDNRASWFVQSRASGIVFYSGAADFRGNGDTSTRAMAMYGDVCASVCVRARARFGGVCSWRIWVLGQDLSQGWWGKWRMFFADSMASLERNL